MNNETGAMPIKTTTSSPLGENCCFASFTQPMLADCKLPLYWVACNRNTFTAYVASPLQCPKVTPTPGILIGFGTAEEASLAEDLLVAADPKDLTELLAAFHKRDGVTFIFPPNPEPPCPISIFEETEP